MTQVPGKRRLFAGRTLVPLAVALGTILFGGAPLVYATGNTIAAPTSASIGRKVQVQAYTTPLFTLGIACKSSFNMNGNNCAVDSYNSALTNASTGGQYDASKALSGGDVGVDGAVVGDVSLGNGNIYGHLFTGAGSQANQVRIGSQGSVGPIGTPNGTVAAGWWSPTFNASFSDVPAPSNIGLPVPLPLLGVATMSAVGSPKYVTSGSYSPGTLTVVGPGTAQLWVQGSMSFGNIILTNGATLVLYVGNTSGSAVSITDSGSGTLNQPGLAQNLQIYGLPTLTTINMSGNAGFNASIYAPEANFTAGGGGSNTQDTCGAITVNSISMNGHWHFHFDENLKSMGPNRGWVAKNWTELQYP